MSESTHRRSEPNRLADESSPYLLQHQFNPVDWYPWGEEALQLARDLDRPIFLSIGYSACHWCHVMERESFESPSIAASMNRWFVNIKVDREERPDLDQIYMNAVMAITQRGGWPMSVFLTPDRQPFFGGTYWPPDARMNMPGFPQILEHVHNAWENRRDEALEGARQLTDAVVKMGKPFVAPAKLTARLLENAMHSLLRAADREFGGFGEAPKFPHAMILRVLLRAWKRFTNEDSLEVVRLTLDKMSRGGVYDHLGGGFHRYSTDERWLAPHFEKMLYDNALLVPAYLEAYQATAEADYGRVARETLDYVLREMTQAEGGFYSTQDADSEGEEGKFFVWYEDDIVALLGPDDAQLFGYCYDVQSGGNWEGKTILNRVVAQDDAARQLKVDSAELEVVLARCRAKLLHARANRIAPARDDKLLVSWNGLMISALAMGTQILGDPRYAESAANAARFIQRNMLTHDGRLRHAFKDGQARFNAYLDDYTCLIEGLVDLYQATFETEWLEFAVRLAEQVVAHFWDERDSGFFYTSDDHEPLIARNKDSQDNATPSGNGAAATALLKLGRLTGRRDFEDKAYQTLELLSGQLARAPMASGQSLIALELLLGPTREFVVVDGDRSEDSDDALAELHRRFHPNKVVARRRQASSESAATRELLSERSAIEGGSTIYVCEQSECRQPVVGREGLVDFLESIG